MRILAVTNIYPSPERPALGTFVEQQVTGLRRAGLEVDVMFVDRASRGMHAYWGIGTAARDRARDFGADVVHVMYGGFMAEGVARAVRDRPVVVSFCGSDLLGELLSGPVRRWVSHLGVLASHAAARRSAQIVVKSGNLRDALPPGIEPARVHIVPNGVDLERFHPIERREALARLGWDPAVAHLLFPANTGDPRKRPWLAREAVRVAAERGAGAVLHELRGVPHTEVPYWINACHAVLLTSLHEGSPNIVKEALACDVPVVSVDVGDVTERLEGIEGCHVAAATPAALADALGAVVRGSGRVAGRARMQELTLARVADRLSAIYRQALGAEAARDARPLVTTGT